MPAYVTIGLLVAMTVQAPAATAAPAAGPPPLTLQQYVKTLEDSLGVIQALRSRPPGAEEIPPAFPAAWRVEVEGRDFEVSTEVIRRSLTFWRAKKDPASLDSALAYLETLRSEALAGSLPEEAWPRERSLLSGILSRPEFRDVRGQSWTDRCKQWLTDQLIKLLGKALSSAVAPVIGNLLLYGLILAALFAAGYWMYRSLRQNTGVETILSAPAALSAKQWPVWMSEAKAAAARGEWANAVHLAYWAGISFLEAQGLWPPDLARTPREYLRLVPSGSPQLPALRALTLRLENTWYGMRSANAGEFEQALAELEKLGCPCK